MSLRPEERALIEKLGECMADFAALEKLHPSDMPEFAGAIHVAQNLVLSRAGYRDYMRSDVV